MRKCFCALLLLTFAFTSNAQIQFKSIDVQHYTFSIQLNDANDTIKGKAIVELKFLKNVKSFQLNLVKTNSSGKGMRVSSVKEHGQNVLFSQENDIINIKTTAKAG